MYVIIIVEYWTLKKLLKNNVKVFFQFLCACVYDFPHECLITKLFFGFFLYFKGKRQKAHSIQLVY